MIPAVLPPNEEERLRALDQLAILDSAREVDYDEIAEPAAQICEAPMARVSLVAADRQWWKASLGMGKLTQTGRDVSFCAHTILQDQVRVIPETIEDPRFADNPLVTGDPHVRFYGGAPLITRAGAAVGALCALDHAPRSLRDDQKRALQILSHRVTAQLEAHPFYLEAANNAVELHRLRTVTVDSKPGRGTTFVLSLPRVEDPLSELPVVSAASTATSWTS
jgi:GAF domain-containing protein